jgi:Fe-S-cluster containining protein
MLVLDQLYASIPDCRCRGLCIDSCGPVPFTAEERDRVPASPIDLVQWSPFLDKFMPEPDAEGRCHFLVAGLCSIYEHRPMVCRLYGSAPGLPCSHGCAPTMTPAQEMDVMARYLGAR